jgi:hypothetical protein
MVKSAARIARASNRALALLGIRIETYSLPTAGKSGHLPCPKPLAHAKKKEHRCTLGSPQCVYSVGLLESATEVLLEVETQAMLRRHLSNQPHMKIERRVFVHKRLLFIVVLLFSTVWLQAQDAGQTAGKTAGLTTIQGCLTYSNGHYRLTEDNGTTHQLQSQANKLTKHVGQEVTITGKPATRTVGTTVQGAASSVKEEQVFKVTSVQHVADTCTAAAH